MTCSSSAVTYYNYLVTDSLCSSPKYTYSMPTGVCPMDGVSTVYDCATAAELNKKWKKNYGFVTK